jgi:hypothetical protein
MSHGPPPALTVRNTEKQRLVRGVNLHCRSAAPFSATISHPAVAQRYRVGLAFLLLVSFSSACSKASCLALTASQRSSYPPNTSASLCNRKKVVQKFSTFAGSSFPGRRRMDWLAWNSAARNVSKVGHSRDGRGRTSRLSRSRACAVAFKLSSWRDVVEA